MERKNITIFLQKDFFLALLNSNKESKMKGGEKNET